MRRSLVLSTVFAATAAMLSACQPQANVTPNKPPATPAPVSTASPMTSPPVSPTASPGLQVVPDNSKKEPAKDVKDVKPTASVTPKPNK